MINNFPQIDLIKTGDKITSLMKENNITVPQLQDTLGFNNPNAIYKWKRGECLPSIDNLVVLSMLFNEPIDKILIIT